jgi:uncharacterized protein YdhG (YjbR/CyaY superfamily)
MTAKPTTHEAYAAQLPEALRPRLAQIQATVEALIPSATRCIGYSMPAWRAGPAGRIFLYVGVFKQHIGVYPPVTQDADLVAVLAPYRSEKGNLTFKHSQPLPVDLIERVAWALHQQYK